MQIYKKYNQGDEIKIKPQYQNEGDDAIQIIVLEDKDDRLLVQFQLDMPIKPTETIDKEMIVNSKVENLEVEFSDDPITSVKFDDDRIKLVLVNNSLLGYVLPEIPHSLNILQNNGNFGPKRGNTYISKYHSIRLATEKDFENFNVSPKGFLDNPIHYEYGNVSS